MLLFLHALRTSLLCLFLVSPLLSQITAPFALTFGTASDERVVDFCVDSGGSYVTAFTFQNGLTFSGGTNPDQFVASNGLRDNGLVRYDFLGNIQWAASWGNASGVDRPVAVACDRNGFIYVTGVFEGSMNANPRFGTELVTSKGSTDAYLIKLTNTGNFVWARTFGGPQADAPAALAVDSDGGLLLAMTFRGTMDANPDPTKTHLVASQGGDDILVVRMNSNGQMVWANTGRGTQNQGASGIAAAFDSLGRAIVAGTFAGSINVSSSVAPASFTSQGGNDVFVATYSETGALLNARAVQGPGDIRLTSTSLAVDSQDNVYLTGMFRQTIDVDTSFGTKILTAQQTGYDVFMASYNRNNVLRWSFRIGGLLDENVNSMRLDRNGTIIIAGDFRGSFSLNPGIGQPFSLLAKGSSGASDGFVAKYRAQDGSFVSGFGLGAPVNGADNQNSVKAAAIDTMGNVVVAGNLFGAGVDFNPTGDPELRSSVGGSDMFLAAYSWRNGLRLPATELESPILRANTNAASFLPGPVVPGSLGTLFGLSISTKDPTVTKPNVARSLPIGTKLCNTEVIFEEPGTTNAWKAPILFCSDFQINYQVPRDLPNRYVTLKVVADEIESNDIEVQVQSDDVGLFMENSAAKVGALTFAWGLRRGQKVSPTNSITACDIMEIYVTGLGLVTPQLPADGTPAGSAMRAVGDAKVVVYDDGTQGRLFPVAPRFLEFSKEAGVILYTGLSPEFVGLYQINMEWPNPGASSTPDALKMNQGDYPAYVEFRGRRSQEFILNVRYIAENPSPCRVLSAP